MAIGAIKTYIARMNRSISPKAELNVRMTIAMHIARHGGEAEKTRAVDRIKEYKKQMEKLK